MSSDSTHPEAVNYQHDNQVAEVLLLPCPHCGGGVLIPKEWLNCMIFRHAQMTDGSEVGPHASRAELDALLAQGRVRGCGRPVRYNQGVLEVCDYL